MDELCIYALDIGMIESEFWNGGMDKFYRHLIHYQNKQKKYYEDLETLGWFVGSYVCSSLSAIPLMTYMPEKQSEANRILKSNQYPKSPRFVLNAKKSKELTKDEIKEQKEKLKNWINNIKPKK